MDIVFASGQRSLESLCIAFATTDRISFPASSTDVQEAADGVIRLLGSRKKLSSHDASPPQGTPAYIRNYLREVANARGLMQVLPSVGEEVARTLKFPVWNPSLLLDPDANLQLGTSHLASYIKQYGALPRVLAAYNAGGSRVNRWSTKKGMEDPEIFIERIPYVETRDYVRIVMRNAAVYQTLAAKR